MEGKVLLTLALTVCLGLSNAAPTNLTHLSAGDQELAEYVNTNGYQLPGDAKRRVRALDGLRTLETRPNIPVQCSQDVVFDAVTTIRGEPYFFKNEYYWKKCDNIKGIQINKIKSTWPSINSVDAAYEVKVKDMAFLFKGQQYWAVRGTKTLHGYPKPISQFGFPASVTKIDGAYHEEADASTLFFVGDTYWRFNELFEKLECGYPKYTKQDFPAFNPADKKVWSIIFFHWCQENRA